MKLLDYKCLPLMRYVGIKKHLLKKNYTKKLMTIFVVGSGIVRNFQGGGQYQQSQIF